MKKFLSLMLFLPLVALVASCSDDDKSLPNVDIGLQIENAVTADGTIYVVQGNELNVAALTVTNLDEGNAGISAASYYWDYDFLGTNYVPPFGIEIQTSENTPLGKHVLEVQCPVFAVNKEPAQAFLQFPVVVVETADELPAEGTTSLVSTARMVQSD
ncbi:MAG: hypothetical protein K2F99_01170 [Muribaculaceae bacterium]|nr:hypothetical protein [Muribaculaceae bacterium]